MPIQTFEEMLQPKFLQTYKDTQGCVYSLRDIVIEFFADIMDVEDDDEEFERFKDTIKLDYYFEYYKLPYNFEEYKKQ